MASNTQALILENVNRHALKQTEPSSSKVTKWLVEQRKTFGTPLTHEQELRIKRRKLKAQCEQVEVPPSVSSEQYYRAEGKCKVSCEETPGDQVNSGTVSSTRKKVRSIESIRNKRKRYKARKKLVFSGNYKSNDSCQQGSITTTCEESHKCQSDASSDLYRGFGSNRWDPLLDEAARARERQRLDAEEAQLLYGSFKDSEPCFPDRERVLQLPKSLSGIDRMHVMTQLCEMHNREKQALLSARLYRDKCTELKKECRQLENKVEEVRYFWRNEAIEGQSRAGKILSLALKKTV